jgi:hypothetical protein
MSGSGAQRGQATVEWVGLLLGVALMFGALVAGGRDAAKGESAEGLGEAVADRITCAARGACGAGERGPGSLRGAPRSLRGAPGARPPAPRSAPPRHLAGSGSAPLRGVSGVAKRAWMLCLGYRRWRYEVDHPRTPRQSVPVRETLDMVNECVNPLSFLFG